MSLVDHQRVPDADQTSPHVTLLLRGRSVPPPARQGRGLAGFVGWRMPRPVTDPGENARPAHARGPTRRALVMTRKTPSPGENRAQRRPSGRFSRSRPEWTAVSGHRWHSTRLAAAGTNGTVHNSPGIPPDSGGPATEDVRPAQAGRAGASTLTGEPRPPGTVRTRESAHRARNHPIDTGRSHLSSTATTPPVIQVHQLTGPRGAGNIKTIGSAPIHVCRPARSAGRVG